MDLEQTGGIGGHQASELARVLAGVCGRDSGGREVCLYYAPNEDGMRRGLPGYSRHQLLHNK